MALNSGVRRGTVSFGGPEAGKKSGKSVLWVAGQHHSGARPPCPPHTPLGGAKGCPPPLDETPAPSLGMKEPRKGFFWGEGNSLLDTKPRRSGLQELGGAVFWGRFGNLGMGQGRAEPQLPVGDPRRVFPSFPEQTGEVFQPAAVLQEEGGPAGAQRQAGGLPPAPALVPHRRHPQGGDGGTGWAFPPGKGRVFPGFCGFSTLSTSEDTPLLLPVGVTWTPLQWGHPPCPHQRPPAASRAPAGDGWHPKAIPPPGKREFCSRGHSPARSQPGMGFPGAPRCSAGSGYP